MFNDFTKAIADYLDQYNVSGFTEFDPVSCRYIILVFLSDGNTTKWYIPERFVRDPRCNKVNFFLSSIINAYY